MGRRINRAILTLLLMAGPAVTGCGAGAATAFGSRFPDNDREMIAELVRVLPEVASASQPANALRRPLLVALTDSAEPELIAYDIRAGTLLWRRNLCAGRRPQVLGDLVVTTEGNSLAAFELASGEPRWRAPYQGEVYLGATRWKDTIVYTASDASSGSGQGRSFVSAVDAGSGSRIWSHPVGGRLGKPQAGAGVVFVPWDLQYLVALDPRTGAERARLRSSDDVISWVKVDSSGVYFGHDSIYRLTRRGYAGVKSSAARIASPLPETPSRFALRESAYSAKPGRRSAEGRIGVLFDTAAGGEGISIVDDRFYLLYYRYLFAFDVRGRLVWSRLLPDELIGGQVVDGGLTVVLESGAVEVLLAKDGRSALRVAVSSPLASVELDAGGIAGGANANADPEAGARSLPGELARIASDPDNRLLTARVLAVEQMAPLPDPEVTRYLLDLYSQSPLPPLLEAAIGKALAERSSGESYLLAELARRHDFLTGTAPPPLPVIVPLLVRMKVRRAVPALIAQLFEPETPLSTLPELVSAIGELGDPSALEPLLTFLARYRADSSFRRSPRALVEAAEVLLRRGDPGHRSTVASIASDPRTIPGLALELGRMLAENGAGESADGQGVKDGTQVEVAPDRLGQDDINRVFARHIDEVRACIAEELGRNPALERIRIAFVLDNDGSAHDVGVSPSAPGLTQCLAGAVARYSFPRFRLPRQLASYTIALSMPEAGETGREREGGPAKPDQQPEKWWLPRARAGKATGADAGRGDEPWWSSAISAPGAPDGAQTEPPAQDWWLPVDSGR